MIKRKASWINPKVLIIDSPIHKKGMFAKEDIKKEEVVFKWGGTFISGNEIKNYDKSKFVIIQVDDNLWSFEPKDKPEDETYFVNHSCNPNVWMRDGITFIARRDIKKGEEVTIDYVMFESEDYVSKWNCSCGSKLCRHKITGKDYLIPILQKRYKNHFSPVINKKIISLKH